MIRKKPRLSSGVEPDYATEQRDRRDAACCQDTARDGY